MCNVCVLAKHVPLFYFSLGSCGVEWQVLPCCSDVVAALLQIQTFDQVQVHMLHMHIHM